MKPCGVYVNHLESCYAVVLGMCNAGLLDHSDQKNSADKAGLLSRDHAS